MKSVKREVDEISGSAFTVVVVCCRTNRLAVCQFCKRKNAFRWRGLYLSRCVWGHCAIWKITIISGTLVNFLAPIFVVGSFAFVLLPLVRLCACVSFSLSCIYACICYDRCVARLVVFCSLHQIENGKQQMTLMSAIFMFNLANTRRMQLEIDKATQVKNTKLNKQATKRKTS